MHSKAKPPTKAERKRMADMKDHGCCLCAELGLGWRLPDNHHILSGGRRMGHRFTIPLCKWHHEGHPPMTEEMGPSLASSKRAFVSKFGTELEIMARVDAELGFDSVCYGAHIGV